MQKLQRRRTWWASIFFGASSQEASTEALAGADHGLLQDDLQRAPLSVDGSVADERFSTNAEEMRRAAGEMECAEVVGELERDSNETLWAAADQPTDKRCAPSGGHSLMYPAWNIDYNVFNCMIAWEHCEYVLPIDGCQAEHSSCWFLIEKTYL